MPLQQKFNEYIASGDPIISISDEQRDWILPFIERCVGEAYKNGKTSFLKDIAKINHSANGKQVSYVMFDEAGTVDWEKVNEHFTQEDKIK